MSDTVDADERLLATLRGYLALEHDVLVLSVAMFAFSGIRFAGLPAHKALIVGPAERDAGGRVTGSYYFVRNVATVPAAAVGGMLYAISPVVAFGTASAIGIVDMVLFVAFGRDFEAVVAR